MWGHRIGAVACAAAALFYASVGVAAEGGAVSIEINKAETRGNQCNMYFMLQNNSGQAFQSYKLDLVVFDADGVIARQLMVETAPLAAGKTVVKAFPVKDMPCKEISQLLLNDVPQCSGSDGAQKSCTAITTVSTRTQIKFIK